jgi:NAD(P)-dependent dehydrogenase (short-subunit alcohol dehydrogenase family)
MKFFKNKYALITGGSGLLGPYHAEALAEDNFNIILVDINLNKLSLIKKKLSKKFKKIKILTYYCDIRFTKNVEDLYKKISKKGIFVSCLVNNAERNPQMKETKIKKILNKVEDYNEKKIFDEIEVGIMGTFNCCKVFGSQMSKKKFGSIINISSDLGITAPDQRVYDSKEILTSVKNFKPIGYSISKHAIGGITKYISTYWAHRNVRCNTLALGAVLNHQPKYLIRNVKKRIPLNRWAKKDEYKSAIKFLANEDNGYMTGQTLIIDGGRTIW